jgi:intracellular septation protein A
MTAVIVAPAVGVDRIGLGEHACPRLCDVVRRTAISLTVACVIPAALFSAMMMAFSITPALIAALVWTVLVVCWRWVTKRPASGLLVLTLAVMTVRTAFTLATGNTFVYFVQPVLANAVVAAVFLASLLTARPAIAWLAGDFYPIDDETAARPEVHRLFRRLTLIWGLIIVVKGLTTLWLLQSQSMVDFVVIKSVVISTLTVVGAGATIWLSAIVARRERMFAPTR